MIDPIQWSKEDMIQALEVSCKIWNDADYTSNEIVKIRKVLKAMIAKLRNRPVDSPPDITGNTPLVETSYPSQPAGTHSWQPPAFQPEQREIRNAAFPNLLNGLANVPVDISWQLFDSNFLGTALFDDQLNWDLDSTSMLPEMNGNNMSWSQ